MKIKVKRNGFYLLEDKIVTKPWQNLDSCSPHSAGLKYIIYTAFMGFDKTKRTKIINLYKLSCCYDPSYGKTFDLTKTYLMLIFCVNRTSRTFYNNVLFAFSSSLGEKTLFQRLFFCLNNWKYVEFIQWKRK